MAHHPVDRTKRDPSEPSPLRFTPDLAAHATASGGPSARALTVALTLSLTLALIVGVLIALVATPDRVRYDQDGFHLPTIRTFAAQWPTPDLRDYLSATTPGYHLLLAIVDRFVADSTIALRIASALFSIGLFATLGWCAGHAGHGSSRDTSASDSSPRESVPRESAIMALVACLPVLACPYVIVSSAWLLPDNLGWWGVLAMIVLSLRRRLDAYFFIVAGVLLLALVMVRQIHLWTLGVLLAAAWLGSAPSLLPRTAPPTSRWWGLLSTDDWRALLGTGDAPDRASTTSSELAPASLTPVATAWRWRFARVALVLLVALPTIGALAWLASLWGGLTPPGNIRPPLAGAEANFSRVHGGNPAVPALVLSLLGAYALFFAGHLWNAALDLLRTRAWVAAGAVLVGLLVAIVPATTYDKVAERWSGVWQLVERLPIIAGHTSVLMLVFAPIGALAAATIAHGLCGPGARERWVFIATVVGFTLAASAQALAWQRYVDPLVLIVLVLGAIRVGATWTTRDRPSDAPLRAAQLVGPVVLSALLAGITAFMLR